MAREQRQKRLTEARKHGLRLQEYLLALQGAEDEVPAAPDGLTVEGDTIAERIASVTAMWGVAQPEIEAAQAALTIWDEAVASVESTESTETESTDTDTETTETTDTETTETTDTETTDTETTNVAAQMSELLAAGVPTVATPPTPTRNGVGTLRAAADMGGSLPTKGGTIDPDALARIGREGHTTSSFTLMTRKRFDPAGSKLSASASPTANAAVLAGKGTILKAGCACGSCGEKVDITCQTVVSDPVLSMIEAVPADNTCKWRVRDTGDIDPVLQQVTLCGESGKMEIQFVQDDGTLSDPVAIDPADPATLKKLTHIDVPCGEETIGLTEYPMIVTYDTSAEVCDGPYMTDVLADLDAKHAAFVERMELLKVTQRATKQGLAFTADGIGDATADLVGALAVVDTTVQQRLKGPISDPYLVGPIGLAAWLGHRHQGGAAEVRDRVLAAGITGIIETPALPSPWAVTATKGAATSIDLKAFMGAHEVSTLVMNLAGFRRPMVPDIEYRPAGVADAQVNRRAMARFTFEALIPQACTPAASLTLTGCANGSLPARQEPLAC